MAAVDFLFIFPAVYAIIDLRLKQNIDRAATFAIVLIFISMIAVLAVSKGENLTFLWSFLFSFLAFTIKGYQAALRYVIVFYTIVFILLFSYVGKTLEAVEFIRFTAVSSIMVVLAYAYERSVFFALEKLNDQKNELESSNNELQQIQKVLLTAKDEIEDLHDYDLKQQKLAKKKQDELIKNQLKDDEFFKSKIFYKSSDILSGDMYSVYKVNKNNIFYFIVDGQGHGILPSLTTFSVATTINNYVARMQSFERMCDKILNTLKIVLNENEQLSYTLIHIDFENNNVNYAIGGMYKTFIHTADGLLELKANNIPAMIYSDKIHVSQIKFNGFQSILSYSDGLVEEEFDEKMICAKEMVSDEKKLDTIFEYLKYKQTEDDVTVVYIASKEV